VGDKLPSGPCSDQPPLEEAGNNTADSSYLHALVAVFSNRPAVMQLVMLVRTQAVRCLITILLPISQAGLTSWVIPTSFGVQVRLSWQGCDAVRLRPLGDLSPERGHWCPDDCTIARNSGGGCYKWILSPQGGTNAGQKSGSMALCGMAYCLGKLCVPTSSLLWPCTEEPNQQGLNPECLFPSP
jgi:hypothetical protein